MSLGMEYLLLLDHITLIPDYLIVHKFLLEKDYSLIK